MPLTIKHTFVSNKPDGSDSTIIRPSNWNADHQITGAIAESDLSLADNTTGNASNTRHGFLPKLPNNANQFLTGTGTFAAITEAGITLADNTTNNVTTGRHGLVPKLPNSATVYLDGTGSFSTPAGTSPIVGAGDAYALDSWLSIGSDQEPNFPLSVTGVAQQSNYGKVNIAVGGDQSETGISLNNATSGTSYSILVTGAGSGVGSGKFVIGDDSTVLVMDDGLVGIHTQNPTVPFHVTGNSLIDGLLTAKSLRTTITTIIDLNGGSPVIDCSLGDIFHIPLDDGIDISPTFTNIVDGQRITIVVTQPSSEFESGDILWPNNIHGAHQPAKGWPNISSSQEFIGMNGHLYAMDSFQARTTELAADFTFYKTQPGSFSGGTNNDITWVRPGFATAQGTTQNIPRASISTALVNISAASAADPVALTVGTTADMVEGQQLAISGATGTMANLLNQKHTIHIVDGTHIELTGRDGTGLVYSGSGVCGTGVNSGDYTIFVVADTDEGEIVFMVEDHNHGCILRVTGGSKTSPVNRLMDGVGVHIGTIVLHTVDATFTDRNKQTLTASWAPEMVAGPYMSMTYGDSTLTFGALGSAPEQFVSQSPGSVVDLDDYGDAGTFIISLSDPLSFAPWTMPDGKRMIFMLMQGVSGKAVTWSAQFINPITVDTTPNTFTIQEFIVFDNKAFPLTEGFTGVPRP